MPATICTTGDSNFLSYLTDAEVNDDALASQACVYQSYRRWAIQKEATSPNEEVELRVLVSYGVTRLLAT